MASARSEGYFVVILYSMAILYTEKEKKGGYICMSKGVFYGYFYGVS